MMWHQIPLLMLMAVLAPVLGKPEPVMEIVDSDGKKAIDSGRVVAGPWVRVDNGDGEGYDCRCNKQNQCHCKTTPSKKYSKIDSILADIKFDAPAYHYGLTAKMKKKHLIQHLGKHTHLREVVESQPDDVAKWDEQTLISVNSALHDAQRTRKANSGLPFIDCSVCRPSGHPVLSNANYPKCSSCEDNGMGGCGCDGFCCSPDCPC
eukprot:TRINITY_DN30434_c0_g1_i1.p1 TRINITY_DN30434_c0_g1~~TRINITY_DN30434_c0_g1_i1.p1  ORF type:complete len:206 (+),score=33.58 TRINITY_DN30434_c0_g1_i1:61-678(+)